MDKYNVHLTPLETLDMIELLETPATKQFFLKKYHGQRKAAKVYRTILINTLKRDLNDFQIKEGRKPLFLSNGEIEL